MILISLFIKLIKFESRLLFQKEFLILEKVNNSFWGSLWEFWLMAKQVSKGFQLAFGKFLLRFVWLNVSRAFQKEVL